MAQCKYCTLIDTKPKYRLLKQVMGKCGASIHVVPYYFIIYHTDLGRPPIVSWFRNMTSAERARQGGSIYIELEFEDFIALALTYEPYKGRR